MMALGTGTMFAQDGYWRGREYDAMKCESRATVTSFAEI